jgi:hypothetical protein
VRFAWALRATFMVIMARARWFAIAAIIALNVGTVVLGALASVSQSLVGLMQLSHTVYLSNGFLIYIYWCHDNVMRCDVITETYADCRQGREPSGEALAKLAREIHPVLNIWLWKQSNKYYLGIRGIVSEDDFHHLMMEPIDISSTTWEEDITKDGVLPKLVADFLDSVAQMREDLIAGIAVLPKTSIRLVVRSSRNSGDRFKSFAMPEIIEVMLSTHHFGTFYGITAFDEAIIRSPKMQGKPQFNRQRFMDWAVRTANKSKTANDKHKLRVQMIMEKMMRSSSEEWDAFLNSRPKFTQEFARQLKFFDN